MPHVHVQHVATCVAMVLGVAIIFVFLSFPELASTDKDGHIPAPSSHVWPQSV